MQEISRLSPDTHRREVSGAHGANRCTQKSPSQLRQKKQRSCSALGTVAVGGPESLRQPDSRKNPTWDGKHPVVSIQWYHIVCSNRLSSALLYMSSTFNAIGAANTTDTVVRCVTFLTRFNHPRVGQNLLMVGTDSPSFVLHLINEVLCLVFPGRLRGVRCLFTLLRITAPVDFSPTHCPRTVLGIPLKDFQPASSETVLPLLSFPPSPVFVFVSTLPHCWRIEKGSQI